MTKVVRPRIRATAGTGQKLSESKDKQLTSNKAARTWSTADRFLHLASRGTAEELQIFVADPETFIENRKKTAIVVIDATALWLKLRGEEAVYVSERETTSTAERKRMSKAFKKFNKSSPQEIANFEKQKQAFFDEFGDCQQQVEAAYSTSGDKYRLTLINISGVEGWLDPDESPKPSKKRSVLLVPCRKHCRVSDINFETMTWNKTVEYPRSDGETERFEEGEPVGQLLRGWVEALKKFQVEELAELHECFDIWGQPRAWTDELIACWSAELIRDDWGQALVFADCLASQWTEAVLLRAWLLQLIWAPYAPEVKLVSAKI